MRRLEDVRGFLVDMDGTVYKGGMPIDGAREFIDFLRHRNIPFVFLSNNSSASRSSYLTKLQGMGFNVSLDNILTSTTATLMYLSQHHPGSTVFPLGTPDFERELRDAGISFSDEAEIVLLAFDKTISYDKINHAYHLLMNGAKLIATHPDELCPTEYGYDVDIGPFIRMFRELTGVEAEVIGKPNPGMVEMASLHLGLPKGSLAMIGDRLYTDMRMARDSGIFSVLVLSGETDEKSLRASGVDVDLVVENIGTLKCLLEVHSSIDKL